MLVNEIQKCFATICCYLFGTTILICTLKYQSKWPHVTIWRFNRIYYSLLSGQYFSSVQLMCNEYVRITKMIPPNLVLLISPTIQRLNRALQPGITLHNWSSISLKSYVQVGFCHYCKRLNKQNKWIGTFSFYELLIVLSTVLDFAFVRIMS